MKPLKVPVLEKCVFCGAADVTKEHVFSRWTHQYMLPRESGKAKSFIGMDYIDRSDHIVQKLPGAIRDWQVKCVCGGFQHSCNSGWMKGIEDAAKPILKPLILGQQTRISPSSQQIIATWASLKNMVAEYGLGGHITVHHTQRKRMMTIQLPPASRWGVWIGHYERMEWKPEWVSRPLLIVPEKQLAKLTNREPSYFNSNCTTQIIGKLFIHVIHTPMPNLIGRVRFDLPDGGSLYRIWPPSVFDISWPGQVMTDRDANTAATDFATRALGIGRREMNRRAASANRLL